MKALLEQLKQELREFIELSKTITHGKWRVFECVGYFDCPGIEAGDTSVVVLGSKAEGSSGVRTGINDATFIARSRNISPAMAECLLIAATMIEAMSIEVNVECSDEALNAYAQDSRLAQDTLQQILTVWEETK